MISGVYIHIPFCKKRCNYCDFYTFGENNSVPDDYIKAVKKEILKYNLSHCPTIYFGGGTPSLLSVSQLEDILSVLPFDKATEITLEANPETLDFEKLSGYYKAGVNRLSIGVQTANPSSLKTLGRIHSANKVNEIFTLAKKAGFNNISADIMLGLPNYSYKELDETLELFYKNDIKHISSYMLKIEEGTNFYKNPPQNLINDDEMGDFYLYAVDKLKSLGYHQYEISNFAKKGYESRHNNSYWELKNYIGIGPSAHSCVDNQRFYYPNNLDEFIKNANAINDEKANLVDYIILSLRLTKGLNLLNLKDKYNHSFNQKILEKLKLLQSQDLLIFENDTISLTPKGFLLQNSILQILIEDL